MFIELLDKLLLIDKFFFFFLIFYYYIEMIDNKIMLIDDKITSIMT